MFANEKTLNVNHSLEVNGEYIIISTYNAKKILKPEEREMKGMISMLVEEKLVSRNKCMLKVKEMNVSWYI